MIKDQCLNYADVLCLTAIIMENSLCWWSAHFGIDSTHSLIPRMAALLQPGGARFCPAPAFLPGTRL